jgi:hypothetical protein
MTTMAFCRDGKIMVVARKDGSVRLWNLQTGESHPMLRDVADFSAGSLARAAKEAKRARRKTHGVLYGPAPRRVKDERRRG